MKKLMVLVVLILLVASVLPATAQDMAEGPWIRVTNFVQDTPPVAVYLNGEQLLTSVSYAFVSEYIALSADQLGNVLDIPHVDRPGYIFIDGIYVPGERQDTITLMFKTMTTNNPLDIPHIDRPGYIFVDGVYVRDKLAHSIEMTVKAGHCYTVALIGQRADDSLQALVMDDTAALVAAR